MNRNVDLEKLKWDPLLSAAQYKGRVYEAATRQYSIHGLYGYPARFSPTFVRQSLAAVAKHGSKILDPFMGSGTSIIESLKLGHSVTGIDLSPISHFIVERLTRGTKTRVLEKAFSISYESAKRLSSRRSSSRSIGLWSSEHDEDLKFKELFRVLERFVAESLEAKGEIGRIMQLIALSAGQWAIDGRREPLEREALVEKLLALSSSVPNLLAIWNQSLNETWGPVNWREQITAINGDAAAELSRLRIETRAKYDLAITSPPYPGVHVLYTKWQLRGRKESNLPSFIVGAEVKPESHWTMGKRANGDEQYFEKIESVISEVGKVLKSDSLFVQLVGFSNAKVQLPRYVELHEQNGFERLLPGNAKRKLMLRDVPSRKWHATSMRELDTKKEVLLVFRRSK